MKLRYYIFFLFLIILSSCKKGNSTNNSLIGRWQETEFYESMGGPASWQPSSSHRLIEFKPDGKLFGFSELNRYRFQTDTTLEVWSTSGFFKYTWHIQELTEEKLELSYSCVEGCGGRYVAIK